MFWSFIHPWVDPWVALTFCILWIRQLRPWVYAYPFGALLSIFVSFFRKVVTWDYMLTLVSAFEEPLEPFPQWLQHFTSADCAQRFSFLRVLANPGYFLFWVCFALFIIVFLTGVRCLGRVFWLLSLECAICRVAGHLSSSHSPSTTLLEKAAQTLERTLTLRVNRMPLYPEEPCHGFSAMFAWCLWEITDFSRIIEGSSWVSSCELERLQAIPI